MRAFNNYEKEIIQKISQVEPTQFMTIPAFISDKIFTPDSGIALAFLPKEEIVVLYLKGDREKEEHSQKIVKFF